MQRELVAAVIARYGLTEAVAEPIVGGGDECQLWRLNSVVVRVSPPSRSVAELAWTHRVAALLAESVPEVTCPLTAADGTTVFSWQGQPVSVWPFVPGEPLDRDVTIQRTQAARLLARLHRTGLRQTGNGRPDATPRPVPTLLPDPALDAWLAQWHRRDEPRGWVHGDFYRRNILCRGGRIVGLIDWDEARSDRLVSELAWSVWEFAKSADGTTLLPDRARTFLNDYRDAGGPASSAGALVPLIRQHLRYEVDRAERARDAGRYMDPDYQAAEIAAFRAIKELSI